MKYDYIRKDVRDEFGDLCEEIGISMASALIAFIRQAIRQREVSFLSEMKMDSCRRRQQSFGAGLPRLKQAKLLHMIFLRQNDALIRMVSIGLG